MIRIVSHEIIDPNSLIKQTMINFINSSILYIIKNMLTQLIEIAHDTVFSIILISLCN